MPNKLIAICLTWLLLLTPVVNAVAAVSMSSAHGMPDMPMSGSQQGNCADCVQHAGNGKAKPCCDGASCALMGGCSACAATFPALRLPVPVVASVGRLHSNVPLLVSFEPEHFLRPPRA